MPLFSIEIQRLTSAEQKTINLQAKRGADGVCEEPNSRMFHEAALKRLER